MAESKSILDTLLSGSSLSALSEMTGAGSDQVQKVLSQAVPTLVSGMKKNASSKEGEQSLTTALSNHAQDDTSDVASFLKNVDLTDGDKILSHILGGSKPTVESGIAQKAGVSKDQTATILAAAAPLLLSLLGNKKEEEDQKESSGGLMSIFSSLLGGKDDKDDGFGLDDVASALLGGSKDDNSGGGLGDMLMGGVGSLFGGGDSDSEEKKKPAAKKPATKKKTAAKKKPSTTAKKTATSKKPTAVRKPSKTNNARKPSIRRKTP